MRPPVRAAARFPASRTWATGAGAVFVVWLAATGSAAPSALPSHRVSAPFHGLVIPTVSHAASGCRTTASVPTPWRLDLATGYASVAEKGRAVNACPHTYGGSHPFSQAITNGGLAAAIDLGKVAPGTKQLIARLGGNLTIDTVVSDGGSFSCTQGLFSIVDNGTYEEWNYRTGPSGGYYANWLTNYTASDNGVWHNSTVSNGVPPSPFVLNSTTYRSHVYSSETYGFCEAVVTSFYNAYAWVYDRTTGNYTNATATTWPVFGYVEQILQSELDFGFYSESVWDGPSGNWTNASGPWTLNASGFLTVNYTFPAPMSRFWYNNSLGIPSAQNTYVNTTVLNFSGDRAWFNQSFAPNDHYYLIVFLTLDQIAWTSDFGYNNNGWRNAYATFTGDSSAALNGLRVGPIIER